MYNYLKQEVATSATLSLINHTLANGLPFAFLRYRSEISEHEKCLSIIG